MFLVNRLKESGNDFQGVYRCNKCHGYRIDKGMSSYNDSNYFENVIPEMQCPLCDGGNLQEEYSMALDTLTINLQPRGLKRHISTDLPEGIESVYTIGEGENYTCVRFDLNGVQVNANYREIDFGNGIKPISFDSRVSLTAAANHLVGLVKKAINA